MSERMVRLSMSDPIDAYEEGVREGWKLALAWAGIADGPTTSPPNPSTNEGEQHE